MKPPVMDVDVSKVGGDLDLVQVEDADGSYHVVDMAADDEQRGNHIPVPPPPPVDAKPGFHWSFR